MKRTIIFTLVVACGLGLLLHQQATRWVLDWVDHRHGMEYEDLSRQVAYPVREDLIEAAHAYNTALAQSTVEMMHAADAYADADYMAQLHIPGTAVIGEVIVPKLDLVLPIYHGSLEGELEEGAGHVYGTSLPVGGPSTHTVIAAHAALTGADRFHHLHDLALGDEFYLVVVGQRMHYVVDQIAVVLPTDLDKVQIVPGEDHATLLTCTPLGINSHRLLVRGVRGPDVPLLTTSVHPGFPWFAVWFVGGVVLAVILARKTRPSPAVVGAPVSDGGGPADGAGQTPVGGLAAVRAVAASGAPAPPSPAWPPPVPGRHAGGAP